MGTARKGWIPCLAELMLSTSSKLENQVRLTGSLFMLTVALAAGSLPVGAKAQKPDVTYEVYALRYATINGFPTRALVAGADSSRRTNIAMMVWLLRGSDGRNVLVDAGFHRADLVEQWHPADYRTAAEAVRAAGVDPNEITDLVITHIHWDHLDGADLFPRAKIWIQREEYDHHIAPNGDRKDAAIDSGDARMLSGLAARGRVEKIDGDGKEILPGITVYTGGKHTFASQFLTVRTVEGTAVIASDNAYLYENLERHLAIAQTLDSVSNLAAQARMLELASDPRLVVPGHDPTVFERFKEITPGVVRIR
jgi:glyoxylase-like metal-dependent hydrolase (beta-lactamase superfamily II)